MLRNQESIEGPSLNRQIFDHLRGSAHKTLWWAVLEDGLRCVGIDPHKHGRKYITPEDWEHAKTWITESGTKVGQFEWVCSIFGLTPEAVREGAQRAKCPTCKRLFWNHFDRCKNA